MTWNCEISASKVTVKIAFNLPINKKIKFFSFRPTQVHIVLQIIQADTYPNTNVLETIKTNRKCAIRGLRLYFVVVVGR